ncbi:hypothetical protein [Paludisphaera sp.]|uniref:hypothetical protein n=1 Tax=Paludisphaera sp. TaxID=2017432 RepID=UPI00301C7644
MRRVAFLCLAALAVTARAEEPPPSGRTIVIRPAKPPTPALSLRLLPSRAEQIPGDAAVFYHRAIESLLQVRHREEAEARKAGAAEGAESSDATTAAWLRLPADKFPREELRKLLGNRRRALEEARLGSLRETCDWGFRHRDEGFDLLLPDIQEMRWLARWVALNARLDAEEGRIDQALRGLKTGLAAARDVGRGGAYIQSLVGIACANHVLDAAEALIEQPGCPNLYWALAAVPRPLFDLGAATEAETALMDQEFPYLGDLDGDAWSLEVARERGDEIARRLHALTGDHPGVPSPVTHPTIARAAQLLAIAKDYRRSKQALHDAGLPPERIEAMPMVQVVAVDSYRTYRIRHDDSAKWAYLPFGLTAEGWIKDESTLSDPAPGLPVFRVVTPARNVSLASTRLQRRIAALMVVEAVRLYAAEHDGALPARLDDLTDAPAPPDPITGGPFDYKVEGDHAVLSGPAPAGWEQVPEVALRYELRRAR